MTLNEAHAFVARCQEEGVGGAVILPLTQWRTYHAVRVRGVELFSTADAAHRWLNKLTAKSKQA